MRAALGAVGDDRFVLPGEGTAGAVGIAPTLEQRTVALIDRALADGELAVGERERQRRVEPGQQAAVAARPGLGGPRGGLLALQEQTGRQATQSFAGRSDADRRT